MLKATKYYLMLYGCLGLLYQSPIYAYDADKGARILSALTQKYQSYSAVKADFVYVVESPQGAFKETHKGTLITRPAANKYKISLYEPKQHLTVRQELISDGKTQWVYLKKENEVQISTVDNSMEIVNPAQIFTIHEKGFKYLSIDDIQWKGATYHLIDLIPINGEETFFKIRLMIHKAKRQLYRAKIFDKNGNIYTYTIPIFTPNVSVSDNMFVFDVSKHPGIEVVDLR